MIKQKSNWKTKLTVGITAAALLFSVPVMAETTIHRLHPQDPDQMAGVYNKIPKNCKTKTVGRRKKIFIEVTCPGKYSYAKLLEILKENSRGLRRARFQTNGNHIVKMDYRYHKKPHKRFLTVHLSNGYRLPFPGTEASIVIGALKHWKELKTISKSVGVDPGWMFWIAIVESNFTETAVGDSGKAKGALQVTHWAIKDVEKHFNLKNHPWYNSPKVSERSKRFLVAALYTKKWLEIHELFGISPFDMLEHDPKGMLEIYYGYNKGRKNLPEQQGTWQLRNFAKYVKHMWIMYQVDMFLKDKELQEQKKKEDTYKKSISENITAMKPSN